MLKKHPITLLFALACFVLNAPPFVQGDVALKLTFISFENKAGRNYYGSVCDKELWGDLKKCDHKFKACVDKAKGSDMIFPCPYWSKDLGVFYNKNNVTFKGASYRINMKKWPGTVKLKVQVRDKEGTKISDHVGFFSTLIKTTLGSKQKTMTIWTKQDRRPRALRLVFMYQLVCSYYYYGKNCDMQCQSHNTTSEGHYVCNRNGSKRCLAGWTGGACKESVNECSNNSCQNGATCIDGHLGYVCSCPTGYTGRTCANLVDECKNVPCSNQGLCENIPGSYRCTCTQEFTGRNCETRFDICKHLVCKNGGVCVKDNGMATCNCTSGWKGRTCEHSDKCFRNPCKNGGKCTDLAVSFYCNCSRGWNGRHCDININECLNNPCLNGGNCSDSQGSFACACSDGWSGNLCERNVDECLSTPCQNGGTCYDKKGSFLCICASGWTGSLCETNVNECLVNQCHGNGKCVDTRGDFFCVCKPGWTGMLCDADIDECVNVTCENHGVCRNRMGHYKCDCKPGWTGGRCQAFIENAACLNGAVCVDGATGLKINRNACLAGVNTSMCNCTEWWSGPQCGDPAPEKRGRENFIVLIGRLRKEDVVYLRSGLAKIMANATSLTLEYLHINCTLKMFLDDQGSNVTQVAYKVIYIDKQISYDLVDNVMERLSDSQIEERISFVTYRGTLHPPNDVHEVQTPEKNRPENWLVEHWFVIVIGFAFLLAIAIIVVAVAYRQRSRFRPGIEPEVYFQNSLYEGTRGQKLNRK